MINPVVYLTYCDTNAEASWIDVANEFSLCEGGSNKQKSDAARRLYKKFSESKKSPIDNPSFKDLCKLVKQQEELNKEEYGVNKPMSIGVIPCEGPNINELNPEDILKVLSDIKEKFKTHYLNHNGVWVEKLVITEPISFNDGLTTENPNKGLKLKSRWQGANGKWLESWEADSSVSEVSKEEYKEAFKEVLSVKPFEVKYESVKTERALHVYLSDIHVGAKVEGTMFKNDYNEDVFLSRLYDVVYKVKQLKDSQGKFDTLVLCDLGDSIDSVRNETCRGGHDLPSNMSTLQMFKTYLSAFKQVIDDLVKSEVANNYVIIDIPGNHAGEIDTMVHIALKEYVVGRYPFIDFKIADRTFIKYEYGKHGFLFAHGKDAKYMSSGLPIDLDIKTENLLNQVITEYDLDTKYKHIVTGDKHVSSEKLGKFFRYKKVGSLFGSSDWINSNFGNTRPSCDYEIVSKNTNDILKGRIEW